MITILFTISAFYIYEEGRTVVSISMLETRNEKYAEQKILSGSLMAETRLLNHLPNIISFLSGEQTIPNCQMI